MHDEQETFEFADFSLTSREWEARAGVAHDVVNPSSDNGRSAWSGEGEE